MQAARAATFRMYHQVRYSPFPIQPKRRMRFGRDVRCGWCGFKRMKMKLILHNSQHINLDFKWTVYFSADIYIYIFIIFKYIDRPASCVVQEFSIVAGSEKTPYSLSV